MTGHPDRFVGLHVFNPVTRMKLIELAFPQEASISTRERTHALCDALGKTAVEVPDIPGFVVNRLLFPYLFSAVELMAQTEHEPRGHRPVHDARGGNADGTAGAAGLRRA